MSNQELLLEIGRFRQKAAILLLTGISGLVLGFILFIGTGFLHGRGGGILTGFLLFAAGSALLILWSRQKQKLKAFIGEHVTRSVLSEFMELETFLPNDYIDEDIIDDLSILPSHNRTQGSDYISGVYKGNPLQFCDLLLQQVTSTGKTTTVVTVFEGQLVAYGLKKQLNGYLEVQKRTAGKAGGFLKRLRDWGTSVGKGRDFESVEMENEAFNEMFDVRAEDPHNAFLVLTPQFMERLMEVNERAETNFCFTSNTLFMAVASKENRFEIDDAISTEADLERLKNQLRYDFRATTSLLDILRNNEYLF